LPELILIMVVALLIFGPRKMPEIGRSIGRALGEFRRASNDFRRTIEDEVAGEELRDLKRDLTAPVHRDSHRPAQAKTEPKGDDDGVRPEQSSEPAEPKGAADDSGTKEHP
jgi:TatA/E family protein of Tat protein translocase